MDAKTSVGEEVLGGCKSRFTADLAVLSGDENEKVASTMEGGDGGSSVADSGTCPYSSDDEVTVTRDGAPEDVSSIEAEGRSLLQEVWADEGSSNDPAGLPPDPHHFGTAETTTAREGSGATILSDHSMLKNVGLGEFPHASCAVHEATEGAQRTVEVAEKTVHSERVHPDVSNIWVKHEDVLGSIGEASGVTSGDAAGHGFGIALDEVPSTPARGEDSHKIPATGGWTGGVGKDEGLTANSVGDDEAEVGNMSSTLVPDGDSEIAFGGSSNGETNSGKGETEGGNNNDHTFSLAVLEDENNIEHTAAKSSAGESTEGTSELSSSSAVDDNSVLIIDSSDGVGGGAGAVEGGSDDPTAPRASSTGAESTNTAIMTGSKGDHIEEVDGISSSSMLDGNRSAETTPNGGGRDEAGRGGAVLADGSDGDNQTTSAAASSTEAEGRDPGSPATTGTAGKQDSDRPAVTSAEETSDRPDDANAKVPNEGEGGTSEESVSGFPGTGSADGAAAKASDGAPTELGEQGTAGQQLGEDPTLEANEGKIVRVGQGAVGNSTETGETTVVGATGGGSGGGDGKDEVVAEIVDAAAAGKPEVDTVDEADVKRARSKVKLGLAHLQQGKARKAAALFDRATSLDPGWWEGFYYSALARDALGEPETAADALISVLQLPPPTGAGESSQIAGLASKISVSLKRQKGAKAAAKAEGLDAAMAAAGLEFGISIPTAPPRVSSPGAANRNPRAPLGDISNLDAEGVGRAASMDGGGADATLETGLSKLEQGKLGESGVVRERGGRGDTGKSGRPFGREPDGPGRGTG
ncbi:unnamed protein product, partial [Sphacelaria rigidula]